MRTKHLLFLIGILFTVPAFSQIPNSGFEAWSDQGGILKPDGWEISSAESCLNVIRSDDPYEGSYSVELSVLFDPIMASNMSGFMFTDGNFPVNQKYSSLSGYFKGTIIGSDTLKIYVGMWHEGEMVGYGQLKTLDNHTGWTSFTVSIGYQSNQTPSEGFISIQLGPVWGGNIGSFYRIDKLQFSNQPTGISELPGNRLTLYPNPASCILHVTDNSGSGLSFIRIVNLQGSTIHEAIMEPGQVVMKINTGSIPDGLYFVQKIQGNQVVSAEKVIIRH